MLKPPEAMKPAHKKKKTKELKKLKNRRRTKKSKALTKKWVSLKVLQLFTVFDQKL